MQSPRAPLYVFFAAFLTFLIAFAALLVVVKPELDRRREAATSDEPARDETPPAAASLANAPAAPSPPAAASRRGSAKSTSAPIDVSGRVVDPRGTPIREAQVHILVSSKGKADAPAWPLISKPVDAEGRFSFRAVIPPSGAFLLATAPGYVRSDTRSLVLSTAPFDVGSVALKQGGSLRVRVAGDEAGRLAGAEVTLRDRGSGPADLAPQEVSARTGADGVALLRGVDRGAYRVRASAEGHADAEAEWRFDGTGRNGTEELSLVLLPLRAWVTGAAVDANRRPVVKGEAAVRLADSDPPADQEWRGALDANGHFRVGPLPRGRFKVQVVAPGIVQSGEVVADADGEPVEIQVEHGGTAAGRIVANVTQFSQPPRVTIWRIDAGGRVQPADRTYRAEVSRTALTFRVDGLGPGRYYARVAADGFAPGRSAPFNVAVGESVGDLAVELGRGGALIGTLRDSRGAPVASARLTAFEGTAPPPPALADVFRDALITATTAPDGSFDLSGLSPGPIVVVVEASSQAARTIGPILVGEGEEVRLGALTIGGGTILSATLADAKGTPRPFARGLLVAADGSVHAPFVADEAGNFCLRGLTPGDYVLSGPDGTTGRTEITLRPDETGRVQFKIERR